MAPLGSPGPRGLVPAGAPHPTATRCQAGGLGARGSPRAGLVATLAVACQGRWHGIPVMASPCRALASCHPPAAAESGRCYRGARGSGAPHAPWHRSSPQPQPTGGMPGGLEGTGMWGRRGDVVGASWRWDVRMDTSPCCRWGWGPACARAGGQGGVSVGLRQAQGHWRWPRDMGAGDTAAVLGTGVVAGGAVASWPCPGTRTWWDGLFPGAVITANWLCPPRGGGCGAGKRISLPPS